VTARKKTKTEDTLNNEGTSCHEDVGENEGPFIYPDLIPPPLPSEIILVSRSEMFCGISDLTYRTSLKPRNPLYAHFSACRRACVAPTVNVLSECVQLQIRHPDQSSHILS
jgi:hypothetical protein